MHPKGASARYHSERNAQDLTATAVCKSTEPPPYGRFGSGRACPHLTRVLMESLTHLPLSPGSWTKFAPEACNPKAYLVKSRVLNSNVRNQEESGPRQPPAGTRQRLDKM